MAKTAQVNGQMELNFTEQKFPKKRSIAKKSVSKPKKEIKKQIAFSSEHYEKAIEIVKEREIIHLGTLMRCLHISAMDRPSINLCQEKSMERRQIRRIDMKLGFTSENPR